MRDGAGLAELATALRAGRGIAAKRDIARAAARLGLSGTSQVPVGDDCAAFPDGDGFLLLAIEGFINEFVAHDPWFAGWCGVMVNVSDIAAMGGRPLAVVDAVWANGVDAADPLLAGLRAAAEAFGVPIVGGHTNLRSEQLQLAVAILGRAQRLLTSFDARPGDRLVAAIDLRGGYREPFANWNAATQAPPARLRGDIAVLPDIAEAGLAHAGKDISQGGLIGTLMMFCECSGVGASVDVSRVPTPDGVALERWLQAFPSFGYLLAVPAPRLPEVLARFVARDIAAAEIGAFAADRRVTIADGALREAIWDFATSPLIGCGPPSAGSGIMPELWFDIAWPNGAAETCYSPSTVLREHLAEGASYQLEDFLARSRAAFQQASDRVQAKFGMPCGRARAQLARIEQQAARFADMPQAHVRVGAFKDGQPE